MKVKQPGKYTRQEVRMHCENDDCWIIVDEKVYDVTDFLVEHPGGDDIIMGYAGIDATAAFKDTGHSPDAEELLSEYYIGDIVREHRQA